MSRPYGRIDGSNKSEIEPVLEESPAHSPTGESPEPRRKADVPIRKMSLAQEQQFAEAFEGSLIKRAGSANGEEAGPRFGSEDATDRPLSGLAEFPVRGL
mmetsp:Transcript_2610/g.5843  ORF Transcript_2610/g.5843 Transcript_2610/m.5843 type:complete len:100 (+) Transcript_2610:1-300(+)